ASDKNLLDLTRELAEELNEVETIDSECLRLLTEKYEVTEINCVNRAGFIYASTNPDFLNYDMRVGEQASEFMVLLTGEDEYVQSYQPLSYDPSISRKYAGVALERGGFVQVGYDASRFRQDIDEYVVGVARNRHVGENGGLVVVDEDWNIVSDRHGNEGRYLGAIGILLDTNEVAENECFFSNAYGEACYCMYQRTEGYLIVAVIPRREAALSRNVAVS
ncbi:MAG: hypothetical protein Q4A66_12795, partial [Eubacteriales bacterium]|nr:hypothetical protein [Eubacteriales bacterium]